MNINNDGTVGNDEIRSEVAGGDTVTITSAGHNIVGAAVGDAADTNIPVTYAGTDILDANPLLAALGNNGGPTPTRGLLPNSPALDAGDNSLGVDTYDNSPLTTDQRGAGFQRISDGDSNGVATIDIGAFEVPATTAAAVSVSGRVVTAAGEGIRGASVTVSSGDLTRGMAVRTSASGDFRVDGLQPGETYVITVRAKHHQFTNPSRAVSVLDDVTGVDFVAQP